MSEYIIEVKNLSKSFKIYHEKRNSIYESISGIFNKKKYYEKLNVLDDVSFTINKGETFGIIGKNGTGKTTLLRLLSKIYKPDKGTIQIRGTIIPFLSLGAGFQIDLTARANIIQYGILLGFKKSEIEKRIDSIMKFAELEKFIDTKLKSFSSGMFARLAFSTAIQVDPDILLIDEVLHVGDIDFQKKSFDKIKSFKEQGKTVVFVTHNMKAITENCDRAMYLMDGKVGYIGEPDKVVDEFSRKAMTN